MLINMKELIADAIVIDGDGGVLGTINRVVVTDMDTVVVLDAAPVDGGGSEVPKDAKPEVTEAHAPDDGKSPAIDFAAAARRVTRRNW